MAEVGLPGVAGFAGAKGVFEEGCVCGRDDDEVVGHVRGRLT